MESHASAGAWIDPLLAFRVTTIFTECITKNTIIARPVVLITLCLPCKYSSTGGGGGYDSLQKALMKKFLLMKSGDVESNPGPYQNNSDDLLLDETPKKVKICHYPDFQNTPIKTVFVLAVGSNTSQLTLTTVYSLRSLQSPANFECLSFHSYKGFPFEASFPKEG